MTRSAVLIAAGEPPPLHMLPAASELDLVVAADGGANVLLSTGQRCDVLIGDLDSITPSTVEHFRSTGTEIHQYPTSKDKTDLELALDLVLDREVTVLTIAGVTGGRIDHELVNLQVVCHPRYQAMTITVIAPPALISVVRSRRRLTGAPDSLISLVPAIGPVSDVSTSGLVYSLDEAELASGSSLGVSNRFLSGEAEVAVGNGVVLAVQPEALPF